MAVAVVTALLVLAAATVYGTGGTRFAYPHLAYVPVIAAAFFFGLPGGIAAGVFAGLALGPFMPLDVAAGTEQPTINWLTRLSFFALVGGLTGLACSTLTRQLQAIQKAGYFDGITGLPNRNFCLEHIDGLVRTQQPTDPPVTVIAIRLREHATHASILGSDFTDQLRVKAARQLVDKMPPHAQLFSTGNGGFSVVLRSSLDAARARASEVATAVTGRFVIDGLPFLSSGHAGIAQHPLHGNRALSLLRASTAASQHAEAENTILAVYDLHRDRIQRAQLRLLPDLQRAINSGEGLFLHYQPVIELRSGRCRSAEALIRWQHPTRGAIPPADFVPAAEQTSLIRDLSNYVLRLAIAQLAKWRSEGINLQLSVNLTARDLEDQTLCDLVSDLLTRHRVRPDSLEIEITERVLMTSQATVVRNLVTLRSLGVSVALDDFGTGHSSLAQLRALPADVVKLDRSFLRDLETDADAQAVVKAAIEMAHYRGQRVVAEGIENQSTIEHLGELSCDFGQGFFIGHPLAPREFEDWLVNFRAVNADPLP